MEEESSKLQRREQKNRLPDDHPQPEAASSDGFNDVPSSTQVPRSLIGTVFADRYEIDSILGTGGMGTVYKARHKLMRRTVAIKVVDPHLVSCTSTLNRFQVEAEAVSCLNHPNVVTVHDFGLSPRAYLVMSYLHGTSLAQLLETHDQIEMSRSLPIFEQICAGLAHAHSMGVVHRDLKPSNIMLIDTETQKDLVKIVDFGIAKLMLKDFTESKHLTTTGDIFGSPLYMSPEQCRGRAMDARSDIYSLGCVMYRTLTGHSPVGGQELIECLFNHVNAAPPRFNEVCPQLHLPNALEEIILKCLEKEQEKRFQSMIELKEALGSITEESLLISPTVQQLSTSTPPQLAHDATTNVRQQKRTAAAIHQSSLNGSEQLLLRKQIGQLPSWKQALPLLPPSND